MVDVNAGKFKFGELSKAQKEAAKDIHEKYKKPVNIENFDADASLFVGQYSDWEYNLKNGDDKTKSIFTEFNKVGLNNIHTLLDTDGDGYINNSEVEKFTALDKENPLIGDTSMVTEDDLLKFVMSAMSEVANDIAPPSVDPPKVDPPKVDPPKVDSPKVDPPKVDSPKLDLPKVDTVDGSKEYKPKNAEVAVTRWGKKPSNGGDQNDCLLRIIQNNYGKDIKYGSDEYWKIANAVMENNPSIYNSGRKIVGGNAKDSSVIYTGEKIKLLTIGKKEETVSSDSDAKAAEAKAADTKVESTYQSGQSGPPTGTKETTLKDGVTTIVNKDLKGNKTGSETIAKDSTSGDVTKTYFDASDKKTSLYKEDKNGRSTLAEDYDAAGILKTSTRIIWDSSDASITSARTVIETKDGGTTYKKYEIKSGENGRSEGVSCDKDGNLTDTVKNNEESIKTVNDLLSIAPKDRVGKAKDAFVTDKLDALQEILENSSGEDLQQIIAGIDSTNLKQLFNYLNSGNSTSYFDKYGQHYQSILDKLYTVDASHVDNIEKMYKFTKFAESGGYKTKQYRENLQAVMEKTDFDTMSKADKQKLLEMYGATPYGTGHHLFDDEGYSKQAIANKKIVKAILTPDPSNPESINDAQELMTFYSKDFKRGGIVESAYKKECGSLVKDTILKMDEAELKSLVDTFPSKSNKEECLKKILDYTGLTKESFKRESLYNEFLKIFDE